MSVYLENFVFPSEEKEDSNGKNSIENFVKATENNALYILDEPENSLSVESQIKLANYIECMAHRSQFIIATHSPIIAALVNAKIYYFDEYEFKNCKWEEIPGINAMYNFFEERRKLFYTNKFS